MMKTFIKWAMIASYFLLSAFLASCAAGSEASSAETEKMQATVEPTKKPGTIDFGVPVEQAQIANPIVPEETSIQRGKEIYEASCIKCHGENGDGKGSSSHRLDPEPADFRAEHVASLSDGELFFIITNGIEDTAMVPFNYLDEDQRWHLVNYIRSFE